MKDQSKKHSKNEKKIKDLKLPVPKRVIDPKHLEEQESLLFKADAISPISKKVNADEIIKLRSGSDLNLDEYVIENYVEGKSVHFHKPFYNVIADLLKVSRDVMEPFRKPYIVPVLKRALVYGRFPNSVQVKIYKRNPYTGYCTRTYWNYQVLTKKADTLCMSYIKDFQEEAEVTLANSGDLKTFYIEYCKNHKLPIQLNLFENMGEK